MRMLNTWKAALPLLFIITVTGCGGDKPPQSAAAEVRYAPVAEERITLTGQLPGRVSALVVAEVRPQVEGIILERLFEEGADVAEGQVLYQIDPAVYRAAHNTAKAALAEAEAAVTALALREKRYHILIGENAISRQDLDNAVSEHGQAKARIARARAELEAAAINLAYTEVKAPVAGRIGASSVTPGALVTANQPNPLAVIRQTGRVHVDMTQPSADTIRLRRAMAQGKMSGGAGKVRLVLEDGSPYTPVAHDHENGGPAWIWGELLFSEISVGQTTGNVALRAVFDNPDGLLLPGMYVTATIEEGTLDNAVLVPQSSVLSSGSGASSGSGGSGASATSSASGASGGHVVFVLHPAESGKFRVERREIRLDRALGNRWIVRSGLSAGDRLVVTGLQKVAEGALVKGVPQESGAAQPEAAAR